MRIRFTNNEDQAKANDFIQTLIPKHIFIFNSFETRKDITVIF